MKKSIEWAAIRTTDGEDWIDIETISSNLDFCEMKAVDMDVKIPTWAEDNPIKEFARVEIKLA